MEVSGILTGLLAGVVIGALGRLLVPGYQRIGCLLTILIGVGGAVLGTALGTYLGVGILLTFAFQITIAALLVSLFGLSQR